MKPLFISSIVFALVASSCGSSENTNQTAETVTTVNTTINGDTARKEIKTETKEEKIINILSGAAKEFYDDWEKKDSTRDANEADHWVYLVGDSYDDENNAALAYDKVRETESDAFIFKKRRKKLYLMKGRGETSRKPLEDSLETIQKRLNARLDIINLSKACRKMPQNTDAIKYKVDGEKKYADCKKCE